MKKKILIVLCCLLWMAFIFYNSSNDGKVSSGKSYAVVNIIKNKCSYIKQSFNMNFNINDDKLNFIIRKNGHVLEYLALGMIVSLVLNLFVPKNNFNSYITILFICLLYAVLDEFHQMFVPGRSSLVSDILIDFGGSVVGVFIFRLLRK